MKQTLGDRENERGSICKVFKSPESVASTPLPLFRLSPEPVCPCTCSSHPTPPPLKLPGMQIALKATARGPSQAPATWRMGRERGAWEGS